VLFGSKLTNLADMKNLIILISTVLFSLALNGQVFTMVKDINPNGNSNPSSFIQFENNIIFSCDDGTHGIELWISNGTEIGTTLIKNINPVGNSFPANFLIFKNEMYFVADDGVTGMELWKTDGTESNTVRITDINPDGSSNPMNLKEFNGYLYFTVIDGSKAPALWRTDGTTNGTEKFKSLSNNYFQINNLTVFKNYLLFNAISPFLGNQLWATDGIDIRGTRMVSEVGFNGGLEFNGELYFRGYDFESGYELWKTDGTANGTILVKDINPSSSSNPTEFIIFQERMLFQADDGIYSRELWSSDGTTEGTELFKDLDTTTNITFPSESGGNPRSFFIFQRDLYFVANKADNSMTSPYKRFLWKSDGTVSGTQPISQFGTDGFGEPLALTNYNESLFFIVVDRVDFISTLYKQSLIPASKYTPLEPSSSNGDKLYSTNNLLEFNGDLYFTAEYDSRGSELWKYNEKPLSVEKRQEDKVNLYPNPSKNILNIETSQKIISLQIMNTKGQIVKNVETSSKTMGTEDLSTGVYFIHIKTEFGSMTERFIKN
jgi:ELWxxDGT repeat protein